MHAMTRCLANEDLRVQTYQIHVATNAWSKVYVEMTDGLKNQTDACQWYSNMAHGCAAARILSVPK
jgi:hypothetical protein